MNVNSTNESTQNYLIVRYLNRLIVQQFDHDGNILRNTILRIMIGQLRINKV